jgi:hypothetical protein
MASSNTIKLKLRAGDREIEVEGSRAEIDEILKTWWYSTPAEATPISRPRAARGNQSRLRRTEGTSQGSKANGGDNARDAFDFHGIAMSMKEDPRFSTFENEILHGMDQWRKVELVLWYVDRPLTSGQIHKILDSLDIKTTLPALSTVLKRKGMNLISNQQRRAGGTPPTYRLTSQAKNEFEKWLKHLSGAEELKP